MIGSAMGKAFGQSMPSNKSSVPQHRANPTGDRFGMSGGSKQLFNRGPSRIRKEEPDNTMAPSMGFQTKAFGGGGDNPINAIEQPSILNPSKGYPGLEAPAPTPDYGGGIGPSPQMDFSRMGGAPNLANDTRVHDMGPDNIGAGAKWKQEPQDMQAVMELMRNRMGGNGGGMFKLREQY